MPIDAAAAGKTNDDNKNKPLELGNLTETPGERMKELVNLDGFKNSIANICQLWLGGIPAPPRRYEQWRSKIVQQEKISFKEVAPTNSTAPPTATTVSSAHAPTAHPPPVHASATHVSTTHSSTAIPGTSRTTAVNGTKSTATESIASNPNPLSFKFNKRKEPHELLEEMYQHTFDPLPE